MKWTYILHQKVKVALVLVIVSVLIASVNLMDHQNLGQLRDSFQSVYVDRLLVESYIYRLSDNLHKKKLIDDRFGDEESIRLHKQYNDSLETLLDRYAATVLTQEESKLFADFNSTYLELSNFEMSLEVKAGAILNENGLIANRSKLYNKLDGLLYKLSKIQLVESKRIIEESNRRISMSGIGAQLEIGLIINIILAGQVLIFASRSIFSKFNQKVNVN